MKKALLIGLVLGLVAAWAVPAMAVDLSATGWIGMRGYVFKNAHVPAPQFTGTPIGVFLDDEMGSYINARAELQFNLRASEDLYAAIKFRMDSGRWGAEGPRWYDSTYNNNGLWGGMNGGYAVQVQELFIDFRVPPKLPLWFRVGLQPVGIRPWIFYFNDCPGVSARVNIDPIKLGITGYYAKMSDRSDWSAIDGSEFYAVDAKLPLSFGAVNIAPGMFFAYQNLRSVQRWDDATTSYVDMASITRAAFTNVETLRLWWLGVNVDGKVGPVNMQVDFIYNGGQTDITDAGGGGHENIGSWLINGQLSYVMKKLEVGLGGRYIQGEDTETTRSESFFLPGGPNFGSESPAISGDFIVFDNGWFTNGPGWPGMGLIDGPSTYQYGYWDVRAFAYYQVLDWFKVGAQLGYIGDTVKHGDIVGATNIIADGDDDDSIGWEMDFGVNVQIYKNLALESGFGYLFAGKALSLAGGVEPNDPWAFQSRLMYFF